MRRPRSGQPARRFQGSPSGTRRLLGGGIRGEALPAAVRCDRTA